MRFKVHCLMFLFILSSEKIWRDIWRCPSADTLPCNTMGMKPVLRVNIMGVGSLALRG